MDGARFVYLAAFFYPARGSLAQSDALLGDLPFYAAFRAAGFQPFSAMQGVLWCGDLLVFFSMWFFLRRGLKFEGVPAAVGAACFAFNHARLMTNHYQMLASFPLPLAAWCLAGWFRAGGEGPRRLDGRPAGAALLLILQFFTSYYLGWFALFGLFAWAPFLLGDPLLRGRILSAAANRRKDLLAAAGCFAAGLLALAAFYLPVALRQPLRTYDEYWTLVPTLWDWWRVDDAHPLGMLSDVWRASAHVSPSGLVILMGWGPVLTVVFLLVAGWALVERLKAKDVPSAWIVSLVGVSLLMAFVTTRWGLFSVWRWIFEWAPGANAIRSVERVSLFLSLPASVGLAWAVQRGGCDRAVDIKPLRRRAGTVVVWVLVFLVFLEQSLPAAGPTFSASREWDYLRKFSGGIPRGCEAFYLTLPPGAPGSSLVWSMDASWGALLSGVPTLNGYSGCEPPGWGMQWIKRPEYEANAKAWIEHHRLRGPIARIQPYVGDAVP